jgi:predicted ribonuclease YlaK
MYMATQHNRDVNLERPDNKGVLKAQYEADDELKDLQLDIRPAINNEIDVSDFPSALNFLPPETFREIMDQTPPKQSELSVAFPLQYEWQMLEEFVTVNQTKLFRANPPECSVPYEQFTDVQKFAIDCAVNGNDQIVYISGKAGCGKTAVALEICELLKGHVQAGAGTGKASSLFNGPTLHAMFGWL